VSAPSGGTGSAWEFDAIGTAWRIETARPLDAHARSTVARIIDEFDREWSRFRSDSVVTGLAAGTRPSRRPPGELVPVTEAAGARASVVAGDVRSANNDRAAASAASRATTTRLRLRSSGDRNGLVDGVGFICLAFLREGSFGW
jgi:hypothetical protein